MWEVECERWGCHVPGCGGRVPDRVRSGRRPGRRFSCLGGLSCRGMDATIGYCTASLRPGPWLAACVLKAERGVFLASQDVVYQRLSLAFVLRSLVLLAWVVCVRFWASRPPEFVAF
eukprot:635356-Prymnesium_polylepis.1